MAEGLSEEARKKISKILHAYLPDVEIIAYGSRTRGEGKQYSDLDLALRSNQPITLTALFQIRSQLAESDFPFHIQLVDFSQLTEEFKKIILSTGVSWH